MRIYSKKGGVMTKLQRWIAFDAFLLIALLGLLVIIKLYIQHYADQQVKASQDCPAWVTDGSDARCK